MWTAEQIQRIEEVCEQIRKIVPDIVEFVLRDPAMLAYFVKCFTSSIIAHLEREHNLALEDAVSIVEEGLEYLDELYFHP